MCQLMIEFQYFHVNLRTNYGLIYKSNTKNTHSLQVTRVHHMQFKMMKSSG